MNNALPFASAISQSIARFVALKQALGRKFSGECAVLKHLDAFLAVAHADLDADSFAAWCRTREHLTPTVRRNWMRVVRNLCLYRRRTEPACFVPDASQFPPPHQPVRPHIFTETEISRLLAAADRLRPGSRSPLHRENFRLALVLLYTTGIRRGELLGLTVGDYDPGERTLLIRESKFHKSRLLPLSNEGASELEAYLNVRRARRLPLGADAPLLWNNYKNGGRAYTGVGFGETVGALFQAAGIRTVAGGSPRVHDFRHAFAVHALLRWYRAGEDMQAKLPLLATYMGHVSVVSTAYYLPFVEQLAASASEQFAQRCGGLITPDSFDGGGL